MCVYINNWCVFRIRTLQLHKCKNGGRENAHCCTPTFNPHLHTTVISEKCKMKYTIADSTNPSKITANLVLPSFTSC